ncbi:hypothetical protein V1525DRAFT_401307 [Lipomyces kononenkoae]|uniref:Uncharacterized protein n=1 Tax=Lipomyces kononenkoae TaxID=34357 RepID=A0ACC3T639_LIPKO
MDDEEEEEEAGGQPARKRARVDESSIGEEEDSRYGAFEPGKKGGNAGSPIMIPDETDERIEIDDDDDDHNERSESREKSQQEKDAYEGTDAEDSSTPTYDLAKGVTRPPRFVKLGVVDGVITVLDDPFSEEEPEVDESEDENEQEQNEAEMHPADLLVKPASKKRLRKLEEAKKNVDKDGNEKVATMDELVEVRGEGRYFGKLENGHVLLCINCHQPGHMASECQVIVCQTCGEQDDHLTRNCPKTRRCSNCNKLGHDSFACKERRRDIYCSRCRSSRHGYETCPSIWCIYTTSRKPLQPISTLFCYNCAEEGHYGDDCPRARPMMQPLIEASVFSARNLASGCTFSKELEPKVSKRGGFGLGTSARSSNVDSYRPDVRDSYRPDHRYGDRDGKYRPRDYPPPRDDYFDRGRKTAERGNRQRNGGRSQKDPMVDKRVDDLRYSDADREDWSRRRQQDSGSRYDYARGGAGAEPKVPGAVSLQIKPKASKSTSASIGGGLRQKISAGKEAFKKLMQ